jgi:hypothetical protein
MELRHLRYFTPIVQWLGYRVASRRLYVAQPSISKAVSDIKDELGIKLFSREGRAAWLTPEGEVFYEEAVKTLGRQSDPLPRYSARLVGRLESSALASLDLTLQIEVRRTSPACFFASSWSSRTRETARQRRTAGGKNPSLSGTAGDRCGVTITRCATAATPGIHLDTEAGWNTGFRESSLA